MNAESKYLLPAPKIAGLLPAVCPRPEPDSTPAAIAFPVRAEVRVAACAKEEPMPRKPNYTREAVIKCIAKGIELDVQKGHYRTIVPEEGSPLCIKPGSTIVKVRANGEDLEVFNGYEWVTVAEESLERMAVEIEKVVLPTKTVACDAQQEQVIPVKTNDRGYYYPATMPIEAAMADYAERFGIRPNTHHYVAGMLWVGVIEDEAA